MKPAKVIRIRGRQAIQLPREFEVACDTVYLKSTEDGFLVICKDPWELFREGIAELSDNFMAEGRQQMPVQRRKRYPLRAAKRP